MHASICYPAGTQNADIERTRNESEMPDGILPRNRNGHSCRRIHKVHTLPGRCCAKSLNSSTANSLNMSKNKKRKKNYSREYIVFVKFRSNSVIGSIF